ncbi:uncharacterized protein LOC126314082 [Schistocerca gregaria]|uniref:uncharacterized protein LOC126314082 n=1 Tax=Schistocerca gregaria TaxID=7010 RepID=UPI00211DD791|nr:uncharacterized protein LOC126314082 [Schistocerca gregaria]
MSLSVPNLETINLCDNINFDKDISSHNFEGGVLPMKFKLGIVKPLYQKEERIQPMNYRPVALTSVFGKLIEKIKLEILIDHHNTNNLIGDFQHGLRSGRSTKSATVQISKQMEIIAHCNVKFVNFLG